ncbi:hypothetical protein ACWELJ_00280 [Nocardia sp. NPDC004582]
MNSIAEMSCHRRPESSDVHLVTLIGIAIKSILSPTHFEILTSAAPLWERCELLDEEVKRFAAEISEIVAVRHNSFTNARRFLVPQVVMAAYFAADTKLNDYVYPIRFADLGTGLGIMPKQLNDPGAYYAVRVRSHVAGRDSRLPVRAYPGQIWYRQGTACGFVVGTSVLRLVELLLDIVFGAGGLPNRLVAG